MHRYCKLLLGSAAIAALIAGATMVTTTEASAQVDIEGLIRGAMSHGYYGGYSYRHHRGKVHESSHERRSKKKEEADDEGSSKGKDDHSADAGSKDDGKGSSNRAETNSSATPAANTNPTKQPVADVPNLTPER